MIVSVASAFQQHFCSIAKGGWRARESSGMLSQAGQQQGIRYLSCQHHRVAPGKSSTAPLPQPASQAGSRSCQRGDLLLMAGLPWLWRTEPCSQWWDSAHPGMHEGLNSKSRCSGTSAASPHTYLPQWHGLAFIQPEGLRPLPDSHLTPVELLVHCFEL